MHRSVPGWAEKIEKSPGHLKSESLSLLKRAE